MGEAMLERMLKDHLEDSHSRQYREMKKVGELEACIREKTCLTAKQRASIETDGMRGYEAWEVMIHNLCLPP